MFTTDISRLAAAAVTALLTATAAWAQTYIPQQGDRIETDNGIYIVKGANLITNNTFDDGFTGWVNGLGSELTEDKFAIWADGGVDGGNCLKALGSAGSSSGNSLRTGWPVTEGKTYLLSLWAYRTQVDGNAQYSRICLANTATGSDTEIAKVKYTAKEWTQTQVVFTADKPFCVAAFSWLNTTSAFDEFYLGELEPSAELATGKLESAISEAQDKLATTVEGEERGQYTAASRATLQEAIDEAQATMLNATTQADINAAVAALAAAVKAYEASKIPPFKTGVRYTFTNVAGSPLVLSSGGDGGTVKITAEGESTTIFTFVPAPEDAAAAGYNLQDGEGNFIYRSGSWDTKASSTTDLSAANAIFQIVDYDSYVQIKNMGSGSVLGVDNTKDGSAVYSNKNGSDTKFRWVMTRYVPADERDDKYYLDIELAAALKTHADINTDMLGTRTFWTSAAAYEALTKALEQVQAMTDYADARILLAEAMERWEAEKNIAPAPGTQFTITHKSGNTLYHEQGNTQTMIYATDDDTRQTYSFIPSDVPAYYYLQNNETGAYLFHPTANAWDTSWSNDEPTNDQGLWKVEAYSDTLYTIKNRYTGGWLGTDATTSGSRIYCDKWSIGNNTLWNVSDGTDIVQLDLAAYQTAIEAAQALHASMHEGYHVGEYYLSDIEAFAVIIAEAEAAVKRVRDQEALNALVAQLQADTQTYAALAHTESGAPQYLATMIEACQAEAEAAVVGIELGNYTQQAIDLYTAAIATAREATDAEVAIEALTQARETFRSSACTVDRAAFSAAITKAQTAADAAVAGDCDGQYPQAAIDAMLTAIDNARQAYAIATATQQDIDEAREALAEAANAFQQARTVIDFVALREAIATANSTLKAAEAEKGDGPGLFPTAAFEALQAVIDQANATVGSKTVNQTAVDATTATVQDAVATFAASRVPNDYSELDALLAYAQQIYDRASADGSLDSEDLEDLAISIAKGQAARQSTLQADIDRAVKILRRDTELYHDILTLIANPTATNNLTIYNLHGQRLTQPQKGVNIINGKKVMRKNR